MPRTSPGLSGGILHGLGLRLAPGTVTLVSGPSGSGKTALLTEIARRHPGARRVQDALFPLDVPVVDAVLPARPLDEALALLTACGLSEPALWLRRFDQLSEGERFRARLARAVGLHRREACSAPLLCDEFGSALHVRLTRAIAFNLRKLISRERFPLVIASCREEIAQDLEADEVVHLPLRGNIAAGATALAPRSGATARPAGRRLIDGLRIENGSVRDYAAFAPMHYRQREQLGFVDRVFVLYEESGDEPVGIAVYGFACLELSLRNRVSGGRWIRQGEKLNRELRVLKRLVLHPDLRGCGVGHWFVRQTLPRLGVPFVECLAAMGALNPVFEKAGMMRVGVCRLPADRVATVAKLRAAGADPFAADFAAHICRRPALRRLVARRVFDWYRATTGGGEARVARQTPTALARTFRQLAGSEPVYFLWARDAAGRRLIERGLKDMGLMDEHRGAGTASIENLAAGGGGTGILPRVACP